MTAYVIQSIDSPRRELDWRLMIAAELYKRGISSFIGSKTQVELVNAISKNCVYFGRLNGVTGRSVIDQSFMKTAEDNGTKIFFLHDEGGFYFSNEYESAVRKIYPESLFEHSCFKRVYFWGKKQEQVFNESPSKNKFKVSGNPRFDLLRSQYDDYEKQKIADLKSKFGKYVLVCTRFGAVNRVPDEPGTLSKRSFDIRVEGGALDYTDRNGILETMFSAWSKIGHEFSDFVLGIAKLSIQFPETNFIIRPHPAEKQSFYDDAFSHFPNVFVTKDGDAREWIKGAFTMIHSECTTGFESLVAGVPVINFRPVESEYKVACVSEVGTQCRTVEELISVFSRIRNAKETIINDDISKIVSQYVKNYSGELASELIVNDILSFVEDEEVNSRIKVSCFLKSIYAWKLLFIEIARKIVNKWKLFFTVNKGDLKFYRFRNREIKRKWKQLTGSNSGISIVAGSIIVRARKDN